MVSGGGVGRSEYVPGDYDSWALVVHTRKASVLASQFSWLQPYPVKKKEEFQVS